VTDHRGHATTESERHAGHADARSAPAPSDDSAHASLEAHACHGSVAVPKTAASMERDMSRRFWLALALAMPTAIAVGAVWE
jgi:hypothetical protein